MIENYWPKGYRETFYQGYSIDSIVSALNELPDGGKCLEIGCGDGYWTNELLVPKFKEVIAIDIIDKPAYFNGEYYKQTECSLKQFRDKSFDVVYSFGVFCHLDIECQVGYLKEIRRILKGKALIVFGNWPRHDGLKHKEDFGFVDGWYYNDLDKTKDMVKDCGFEFIDFDPSYRDTIGILW